MQLKRFLKDPLTHFVSAGALLFILLSLVNPLQQDDRIVVDRQALLDFIQYRSKAFEPGLAASILDRMNQDERERLIDDYIREEALYREALKLGLDTDDYVIRQRMVQKLEFVSDAGGVSSAPAADDITAYYAAHRQDYFQPPVVTFSHVFIAIKGRTRELAIHEAQALLKTLVADNSSFSDATRYGERFLFHTNYVERTYEYIKSDFGAEAADLIFSERVPIAKWFGPVESKYGAHLIFISRRTPGRHPSLTEIKPLVVEDYEREFQRQQREALTDAIIQRYSPVIELDITNPGQPQGLTQ